MKRIVSLGVFALCAWGMAQTTGSDPFGYLEVPVTAFSNMESGYQATNPGFRLILKDAHGNFLAGSPLTMDAVMNGRADDASAGSPYGKTILHMDQVAFPLVGRTATRSVGSASGRLSICMAADPTAPINLTQCKDLAGNNHTDRPYQWLDKQVDYTVDANGNITITKYYGDTGEGGTSEQLSLALYHPAFGFAAPGKAFKDYESPLVLDLDHNGNLDLVNVWNERRRIAFDLNGTGERVRTGWVQPTDGFLFIDNGTGCVKDGTRLLGNHTGSKHGEKTFKNGFEALAAIYDTRHTGRVVAAEHPELKIWKNTAQDGVCKASEVFPATKFLRQIELAYQTVPNVKLTEDNEIRLTGTYTAVDGKKGLVGDVWFKQRRNPLAQVK